MRYLIGEMVEEYAKRKGKPLRQFAIDNNMGEVEFALIRKGHRVASGDKLSTLINIEILRDDVINEIKQLLDTLDTNLIIQLYNSIYIEERKKK